MGGAAVVVLGVLVLAVLVGIIVVKNVIFICQPNEVLIFSGKRRQTQAGMIGYRLVRGGRGIRIPLFERVDRMDLTNMIIDLRVSNAYSKGGIPLTISAVANIKVAGMEPRIHNAIERLLGATREQISDIARETLEGNVRGVLASLTPEEVNMDRTRFEQELLKEAELDLSKLGIALDTLNIQSVSDDKGYLTAIGRRQNAELQKRARIAEANAQAQSAVRDAENARIKSIAQITAEIEISKAEAERRLLDARTKGEAMVAESRSDIVGQKAKAEAEVLVQKQRLEQVRRKLQADLVEPAKAMMLEKKEQAQGRASKTIEDGKAQAEAFLELVNTWKRAGKSAREIFMVQKLDMLIQTMIGTVRNVNIDKMTMIDSKVANIDSHASLPMKTASGVEQIKQTLGVDLAQVAKGLAAVGATASSGPPPRKK